MKLCRDLFPRKDGTVTFRKQSPLEENTSERRKTSTILFLGSFVRRTFSWGVTLVGVPRTQKLRSHVFSLKPGVGQNIAMHAFLTAKNVFLVLISTFPVHSASFSSQILFLPFDCVSFGPVFPQNKIDHAAHIYERASRFPWWSVPFGILIGIKRILLCIDRGIKGWLLNILTVN